MFNTTVSESSESRLLNLTALVVSESPDSVQDENFESGPPEILFYVLGLWAMGTGLTGTIANLLAIILFITTPKLKTPFNYLLMNLSACELVISVSGNSVLTLNSFAKRWMLSFQACQANAFGMTFLGIMSIVTLSILALQRFMMITQDRQFPLSTTTSSLLTLLFIWAYSFSISIPPVLGWGKFGLNALKVSCGFVWDVSLDEETHKLSYIMFIYTLGFILPLIIIFFSYVKIIAAIKKSGMSCLLESDTKRRAKIKRDRKITKMVAIMLIAYLVTWFPYACVSIAEAGGYYPYSANTYMVHAIPTILVKACVCLDPLVYFWFNPQFRSELKKRIGARNIVPNNSATTMTAGISESGIEPPTSNKRIEQIEMSSCGRMSEL